MNPSTPSGSSTSTPSTTGSDIPAARRRRRRSGSTGSAEAQQASVQQAAVRKVAPLQSSGRQISAQQISAQHSPDAQPAFRAPTQRAAEPRRTPRPATAAATPAGSPSVTVADTADDVAPDGRSFAELGVPAALVAVLDARGVTSPFPIQSATLPDSLAGRDVLGRGRTGSGKTIAFALPLVAQLAASGAARRASRPRSLVLVPTRELATQVASTITPLAQALGMRTTVVFGGVGQNPQVNALRDGVDVLIACPGRLEDLIGQGHCRLDAVEVTVLDEADHMADLGFLPGVKRLLDSTPKGGQRLLFSATLDNGIDVLVKRYLDKPMTHSVDPAVAPVSTMEHHVLEVSADGKGGLVKDLASGEGRTLLFTRTKHGAKKLAKQLTAAGVPAVDLHGNLSQNARERNLGAFTDGSVSVLVATDIAARGIHVDDIALVVHVDPPTEHKAYLHRSGRTARAGAGGTVVTVATPDQRGDVRTLARQAGINPQWTSVSVGDAIVGRLTGPRAAWVDPATAPVPQAPAQPQRAPRAAGSGSGSGQPAAGGGRRRGGRGGASTSAQPASSRGGAGSGGAGRSGGAARSGGQGRSGAGRSGGPGGSSVAWSSSSR